MQKYYKNIMLCKEKLENKIYKVGSVTKSDITRKLILVISKRLNSKQKSQQRYNVIM